MKIFIYSALAATLCVAPAMAQPQEGTNMFPAQPIMNQQPDEPQRQPYVRATEIDRQIKDDLSSFGAEFSTDTFALALRGPSYIFGARRGLFGASAWLDDISYVFNNVALHLRDVSEIERNGDEVSAVLEYNFEIIDPQFVSADALSGWKAVRREKVRLRDETQYGTRRTMWKIVPPATPPGTLTNSRDVPQDDNFWNIAAFYLAQNQPYQSPFTPAERSTQKLKILGLGALMFCADFDSYALDGRYIEAALDPYLPQIYADTSSTFRVPDSNEIYTFNENLSGLKTDEVKIPAQTVLFYEGQDETPIFRYDGSAAICFADGHVALVMPDEAKSLIWKP